MQLYQNNTLSMDHSLDWISAALLLLDQRSVTLTLVPPAPPEP